MKVLVTTLGLAAFALAAPYCFNPEATVEVCVDEITGKATFSTVEDVGDESLAKKKFALERVDADVMWVLICGILVFFMQAGFSMLEAGCVSSKNVQNILYKNLMDACIGAIAFWVIGYGLAYGNSEDGSFIGGSNFLANEEPDGDGLGYHSFFFQWAFAATAATIVSGAVAERTKLSAYFIYSIFLTAFVYPVVVHWVWDSEGWLCAWKSDGKLFMSGTSESNGFIDFAGSGVVHMVGGFSGLMGAIAVGPRQGIFDVNPLDAAGNPIKYEPHNKLLASLGVCILWFGWYGFNGGSTLMVSGGTAALAAKVCVTTTLAASSAAITCTVYSRITKNHFDLMLSLNGVLAGLVSITANCAVVEPWGAVVIGFLGAFVFIGSSALLKKLKIDDPLDACPIHGCCGFWGVLCSGIFGLDANVGANTAIASGEQFGVQLIGGLAIMGWTIATSGALFFGMKFLMPGGIRVPNHIQTEGLDMSEHGGAAYSSEMMGLVADDKSVTNGKSSANQVLPEKV